MISPLTAILAAKFTRKFETVQQSPHAAELLETTDAHACALVATAEADYQSLLLDVIRGAEQRGEIDLRRADLTPEDFAAALMRAAHGAEWNATTAETHRQAVQQQVHLLLGAVRPLQPA